MNNGIHINIRYVAGAIVATLVLVGLLIFANRPGTLVITSDSDADIAIGRQQGGDFTKIGRGSVTYKTRDFTSDVYIRATKGSQITVSGATLKRGQTKSVSLPLGDLVSTKVLSDGGILSARKDGELVQGIVPFDYSVTSFRTDRYETTRPGLVGLPYIQKIVWYDANNFVYLGLSNEVGLFVNGADLTDEELALSVSDPSLMAKTDYDETGTAIIAAKDIARAPDSPLVLATSSGVLVSSDMGRNLQALIQHDEVSDDSRVFATKDEVLWLTGSLPASTADEAKSKPQDDHHTSNIIAVDYSGKKTREFSVDAEEIIGVTSLAGKTYILADDRLVVQDGDQTSTVPVYFKYAADIINYQDSVLLLADNAIWRVADDGDSVQLLSQFNDVGVGLRGSFSINPANELLFSTTQSLEATDTPSKLLSLSL